MYSRKVIGWEVHETDSSDHAVDLVRRTALAEKIHSLPAKPVLHGDNGATLKATTVLAMLTWLGIRTPTLDRESVTTMPSASRCSERSNIDPNPPTKVLRPLRMRVSG